MTIKTSDLGGADWADGDIGFAADFNDTFGAVTLHRKQFSDATERTIASGSWVDSGTEFTLEVPVGSMIIGCYVTAELKNLGIAKMEMNVKFTGSNLGTLYLAKEDMSIVSVYSDQNSATFITAEDYLLRVKVDAYSVAVSSAFTPLKILDASTTLTIRGLATTNNGFIRNVTIDILYTEVFKED